MHWPCKISQHGWFRKLKVEKHAKSKHCTYVVFLAHFVIIRKVQESDEKNERNVSSGTETVNRTTLVVFSLVKEFHSASKLARPRGDRAQGRTDMLLEAKRQHCVCEKVIEPNPSVEHHQLDRKTP